MTAIDNTASSKSLNISLRTCAACEQTVQKMLRCSACKIVYYCNSVCQSKAWPEHKKVCVKKEEAKKKEEGKTSIEGEGSTILTIEQAYVKKLSTFPLKNILDRGETEKACKKIGQEIFDLFKKNGNGDTQAGKEAVQKICNALSNSCPDGKLRKQYVEYAWDGIGDSNWFWMH